MNSHLLDVPAGLVSERGYNAFGHCCTHGHYLEKVHVLGDHVAQEISSITYSLKGQLHSADKSMICSRNAY